MGSFEFKELMPHSFFLIDDILNEIEISNTNITDLNVKDVVKRLSLFCLSDKFKPLLGAEFLYKDPYFPFCGLISLLEMKEKFLTLKILIPLLEQLRSDKFDKFENIINDIFLENKLLESLIIFSNEKDDEKGKMENSLFITEKWPKLKNGIEKYFKENNSYIGNLFCLCFFIISYVLFNNENPLDKKIKLINPNMPLIVDKNFFCLDDINNNIIDIMEKLIQTNSLNYTKNISKTIIFLFNLTKITKEISLRDKLNENFFESLGDIYNIDDKLKFILYEESKNESITKKKYVKTILEGKMTKKEKNNFDVLDLISKIEDLKGNIGISGNIYRSLFYDSKIILIIKLNFYHLKQNKTPLEQIQKAINFIQEKCSSEYKKYEIYSQIANKIINLDTSYDLFLRELKNRDIIEANINILSECNKIFKNKDNDEKKLNENNKIYKDEKIKENKIKVLGTMNNQNIIDENNKSEINELQFKLDEEKDKNKKLEEKIKILERDLDEEKHKNKKLDIIIEKLRKDLDKEIKKYNDMMKQIEEDKISKKKLEKELKDSFLETIIEKDREIKELKLKLSRFPLILEEGEKLLSITFESTNQQIHDSLICKNTDEFHKIEGKLYEKYPEFSENQNFFMANGKIINKYKTLEQNGIKNSDVIVLNEIE